MKICILGTLNAHTIVSLLLGLQLQRGKSLNSFNLLLSLCIYLMQHLESVREGRRILCYHLLDPRHDAFTCGLTDGSLSMHFLMSFISG